MIQETVNSLERDILARLDKLQNAHMKQSYIHVRSATVGRTELDTSMALPAAKRQQGLANQNLALELISSIKVYYHGQV